MEGVLIQNGAVLSTEVAKVVQDDSVEQKTLYIGIRPRVIGEFSEGPNFITRLILFLNKIPELCRH